MVLDDTQWDGLWRAVAARLAAERAAGRGHLLTEDVLRYQTVLALADLDVSPDRLRSEFLSPYLRGGKVDLMVDAPTGAAIEFKFPRDSSTGISPDTMTFGELLKDVVRMPMLQVESCWVVQAINSRLERYLRNAASRLGFSWPTRADDRAVLTPTHVAELPTTAARSLGGFAPTTPIGITCRVAAPVDGQLTLFAHTVAAMTEADAQAAAIGNVEGLPGRLREGGAIRSREGARREILATVTTLLSRRGLHDVSVKEIVIEMRRMGSSYAESTIRTMVTSHMCAGSQGPGVAGYDDLVRTGRGRYRPRPTQN